MWRRYLLRKKFVLKTDNMELKYIFEQQNLNARQARRLAFLNKYNFEVKHIKGKEDKVSYALNRRINVIYELTTS